MSLVTRVQRPANNIHCSSKLTTTADNSRSNSNWMNNSDIVYQLTTISCCFSCGVSWSDSHVSLDCRECGGYALERPCPDCNGLCGAVWTRDLPKSHGNSIAVWQGTCGCSSGSNSINNSTNYQKNKMTKNQQQKFQMMSDRLDIVNNLTRTNGINELTSKLDRLGSANS